MQNTHTLIYIYKIAANAGKFNAQKIVRIWQGSQNVGCLEQTTRTSIILRSLPGFSIHEQSADCDCGYKWTKQNDGKNHVRMGWAFDTLVLARKTIENKINDKKAHSNQF